MDDSEAVLNAFLRRYLEDQGARLERPPDAYRALFPGHEELIERELANLRGAAATDLGTPDTRVQESAGQRFGAYTLVRPLGQGGQGLVWLARDSRLDRPVALKILNQLAALSPQALERFHREAQITSRLDDPGICTVYETGRHGGVTFIAMRYVDGETLAEKVERARNAPREERAASRLDLAGGDGKRNGTARVAQIVERVARSLHLAHEAGIVHRDLKPANIVIGRDGTPVLLDFGLAGVLDETFPTLTRTGDVFGTPAYMAPEQISGSGRRLDRRTDVYSLGATLYECLTLKPPFESVTREGLFQAICHDTATDARRIDPTLPSDLETILETSLAKDPNRRYQTALALAEDLRRWLAGEAILARTPSPMYRLKLLARRHRTLAASLVAILLILAVATVVTTSGMLRAQARAAEVLRLSALQDLDDLVLRADALWPARADRIPELEAWLADAHELVTRLPEHERTLIELRERALPPTESSESEAEVSARPRWVFADSENTWWHGQVEKLTDRLKAFSDPETGLASSGTSPEHGWGIVRRAESARTIAERSVSGADAAERWREAIASIADPGECPFYGGLLLTPQLGLLPLGRDPESGLWEFAHLETGEPAVRHADGKLLVQEETGLVLVLLPGGTFEMGAQSRDMRASNYDPEATGDDGPVHVVTLSPFFLSKYEMTQGQWLRFTGANPCADKLESYSPSWNAAGRAADLSLPVVQVIWWRCTTTLERMGLMLPSEEQWEYGARGGTTSVWWTGDEKQSLSGAANLADRYALRHGASGWIGIEEWLDDGNTGDAHVGTYRANPFGLFDVHGNVWEWCRDGYHRYGQTPGTDRVIDPAGSPYRVYRGGCFSSPASESRSAFRRYASPALADGNLGVRPAASITP